VIQARFDADYLRNPPPAYPALSRRMGEEGQVILRVFVSPEGHPAQIDLQRSSGSPRLDLAAREAVSRWQFVAARRGNEAFAAWVRVPIIFKLRD
jgi:protein TonB